ncbi:MAG: TaqI-like C-terminal specificity domain-containing protein [Candidatus Kapaibacterium sp.]
MAQITIAQSLAKSFANKLKVTDSNIKHFERELIQNILPITKTTSERTVETLCKLFLDATYSDYGNKFKVMPSNNTNKIDFCILDNNIPVVLIEAKTLNSSEMCQKNDINKKALHQLIFYYLKERYNSNFAIKHLIATNGKEWFIFDAVELWKSINRKTKIETILNAKFNANQSVGTGGIYNAIEKEIISNHIDFEFVYFDLSKYNSKSSDDKKAQLYKILSPTNLLKIQSEESHGLDRNFYSELLYIMGLEETGTKKKTIGRLAKNKRENGSFIELTIRRIREMGFFSHISNPNEREDAEYDTALQLIIVWINRILFLKLLEAQLFSYHSTNNDKDKYLFMKYGKLITSFDKLETMFSGVLNRPLIERKEDEYYKQYNHIPYLNSSLFEVSELEKKFIVISTIDNDTILNYKNGTRFSNTSGVGYNTLEYLLNFLDMYDFYTEAKDDIVDDNKPLIRANVLGLIFEKINGYKDGSYYTPGYITEYMCRETIRKTVLNKFAQKYNNINSFTDIKNLIIDNGSSESLRDYNDLMNSITILDPAVGSGHFLVSALNELIAIKSELKILIDEDCRKLTSGFVANINDDELTISNRDGIFVYEVNNNNEADNEPQQIQKALFYQKKQIIENCLFGVDINPNSVNICRLRLWIELLKNCYYEDGELQTLPNIDINIKCGNSLISRYDVSTKITNILNNSGIKISKYLEEVNKYKNASSKIDKRKAEDTINKIKSGIRTEFNNQSKENKELKIAIENYNKKFVYPKLFDDELTPELKSNLEIQKQKYQTIIDEKQKIVDDLMSSEIYKNSLEWRFEFPEVLNPDTGDYLGFDVVIANPPYLSYYGRFKVDMLKKEEIYYKKNYSFIKKPVIDPKVIKGRFHSIMFFSEKCLNISSEDGIISLLVDLNIHKKPFTDIREYMFKKSTFLEIINDIVGFDNVFSGQSILFLKNKTPISNKVSFKLGSVDAEPISVLQTNLNNNLVPPSTLNNTIIQKVYSNKSGILVDYFQGNLIRTGITFTGMKDKFLEIKDIKKQRALLEGKKSINSQYCKPVIKTYINYDKDLLKRLNDNYANVLDKNKNKKQMWIGLGDSVVFKSPKLIILQTGNKIIGTYSEEDLCLNLSLFSISNINEKNQTSNVDLKLILGQLNSKILTYFAIKENYIQRRRGAVPQIRLKQLKELPIIIPELKKSKKIVELVDKILAININEEGVDTSDLQSEIDTIMYKLYDLSDEEIKEVDGFTVE